MHIFTKITLKTYWYSKKYKKPYNKALLKEILFPINKHCKLLGVLTVHFKILSLTIRISCVKLMSSKTKLLFRKVSSQQLKQPKSSLKQYTNITI